MKLRDHNAGALAHLGNNYVGRFAPSPTGRLHFGSLVAALASYLDARANAGKWLVRMEDLDTERVRKGAAGEILRDLERFGLEWDGPVLYQSQRVEAYEAAFSRLLIADSVYPCSCSRKETAGRYPGTCAGGLQRARPARAWRLRLPPSVPIAFQDAVQGRFAQDVQAVVGDFIVRRADGPFAYQLAVVVDDAAQGVTHVVRGADLVDNVPRQVYLQRCLDAPAPEYAHVPVATDKNGVKLGKSTGAAALEHGEAATQLRQALAFLGQEPPAALRGAGVREILAWAAGAWSIDRVPRVREWPFEPGEGRLNPEQTRQ